MILALDFLDDLQTYTDANLEGESAGGSRDYDKNKKFILFSQIKYRENNIIISNFNYNIIFKQNYIADRI